MSCVTHMTVWIRAERAAERFPPRGEHGCRNSCDTEQCQSADDPSDPAQAGEHLGDPDPK
jgi:hypothetical protein